MTYQEAYKKNEEVALKEYFSFLSIPSISSEPAHKKDVETCAQWVYDYLKNMGMKTQLWETTGHPVVFASWMDAGPDKPTLLIYNHYDVQPVDPLDLWKSAPFSPTVVENQVFARGAQDNKGQCFYVLQALKLLLQETGKLPINIKMIVEGEEECGSNGLQSILYKYQEDLHADYLAIVDLGIPAKDQPAITLGIRGIVTMDVTVTGSSYDLHSGIHGGVVYNPIHALAELLAKVRNHEGRVNIPGFYDNITELAPDDRLQLTFDFDAIKYGKEFGVTATGGEHQYTPNERAWLRPTFEVNGIYGGYTGEGFKTVIPAHAYAKVSCRLVAGQDPFVVGDLVAKYLESHAPAGTKVSVHVHSGGGPAVQVAASSPLVQAFSKAYEKVFHKPCKFVMEGGSIPIVASLSKAAEAEVVLVGLGLLEDRIHAPNEHFSVDRLEKGTLIMIEAIQNLKSVKK